MTITGLRIVLVGPLPPPAGAPPTGGMANQTRQLAALLQAEGAGIEVVAVNAPYRPAWIGRVRGLRAAFRLLPYAADLWRALGRAQLVHVMANSGWSWHLFAAPAVWIAWLRGVPAAVNYRGGEAEVFFDRAFAWVKPTLRRAGAVIVPSGFLEAVFGRRGVPARVVPNVVDLERFRSRSKETDRCAPHLVVTRNLEPIYDIPTALRAFAEVHRHFSGARLTVAGSGPLRGELERLAVDLGIAAAVRFSGRLDNERMADLYRDADLMLNPSRVDNMPISILEALACGVPVVSTDVGGVPFLVEDGRTALLVPPGDARTMAAAVLRLLDEPGLAHRLSAAGAETVRQYSWPVVREKLFAVYAEMLARGRATAITEAR